MFRHCTFVIIVSAMLAGAAAAAPPARSALAKAPDLGSLLGYRDKQVVRERFGVRYAVDVSEAHAARAVAGGALSLRAPDGELLQFAYERHVEHADGNWTWFGHDRNGADVVITFGENAVFGTIAYGRRTLLLTTAKGQAWLVDVDLAAAEAKPRESDYSMPENTSAVTEQPGISLPAPSAGDKAEPDTRIDVLIGYTPGVVARYGGESQAVTRVNYLVDVANQAMVRSRVTGSVNLRKTMLVNWPDNTGNPDTLNKLWDPPTDPAFNALREAREQYGADLVALVRRYDGAQGSCGRATIIGAMRQPIRAADAQKGYAVVGDGTDPATGGYCSDESYAHELGHNLGQQHDAATAGSTTGAHLYSYGYREPLGIGFATIMAYPGRTQYRILYYANPLVLDAATGRPTGVLLVSDNALSMNQTIPLVAQFRARVP